MTGSRLIPGNEKPPEADRLAIVTHPRIGRIHTPIGAGATQFHDYPEIERNVRRGGIGSIDHSREDLGALDSFPLAR